MKEQIFTNGRHYLGAKTVAIRQIRDSEGLCSEFDINIFPIQYHSEERWLSIASASRRGMTLPPVDLIKVGDSYYVRDGYHRISVAQALRQEHIEAVVWSWEIAKISY